MPQQYGLGAFVGGLQEGYSFTQDAKRRRQQEKIYDQAIESGAMDLDEMRNVRKDAGLEDLPFDSLGDDPFQQLMKKGWQGVKGAFSREQAPAEAAQPAGAPQAIPADPRMQPQTYPLEEYNNGGRVRGYALGGAVQPWQPTPMGIPTGQIGSAMDQRSQPGGLPLTPPSVGQPGVMLPQRPGFAAGGRVETPGEIAKRLAEEGKRPSAGGEDAAIRERARLATERRRSSPAVPRDRPAAAQPAAAKPAGPEPKPGVAARAKSVAGRAGGALKRGVAGVAAGGALAGAANAYGTDTMDMADNIGIPRSALGNVKPRPVSPIPSGPDEARSQAAREAFDALGDSSFWKDVGTRALGTAQSVGDSLMGMVGLGGDEAPAGGTDPGRPDSSPPPAAKPAAPEAAPARTGIPPVQQKEQAAQPAQAQAPVEEFVDPASVDLQSIPDMDVTDWVAYRQQARQTAARSGKLDHIQKADAYVDDLQHRGFLHYGNIALQHLQNGDEEGAAKSLMMAYQYFPNGTTLRFGVQKGKLMAVGIDPKTGQPKGAQALDPRQLAMQLSNFQKPENFKTWTLDWRAQELQEKAEGRMQQTADQQGEYQDTMGQAAMMNAGSNRISAGADVVRAQNAGGAGGLKPDTVGSAEGMFLGMLDRESMTNPELQDPENTRVLASVMSKVYQQNGGRLSPQEVVQLVLGEYKGMQSGAGE